ncbi:MAG TPA: hypothetical protein VGC06_00705 [Actinomycetes bacterium]
MPRSATDRGEQAQLLELFSALEATLPEQTRLAETVTFWRHQLMIGVEPSQLAELMSVLDEVAEHPDANPDLQSQAAKWHAVLEPRVPLLEPWQAPPDR